MNKPSSQLHTDYVDGERLFWASEPLVFSSVTGDEFTSVVVPANFLSDGVSTPKPFQNLVSKSPEFLLAGVLHDWTYRRDCVGMTRRQADKLFLKWMAIFGVGYVTRKTIYYAVRLGAWAAWKKRSASFYTGNHTH